MHTSGLFKLAVAIAATAIATGCDDGKIYPSDADLSGDNGISVVMTGTITGAGNSYESGYTLALAAFNEGNEFAVASKTVGDGSETIELTNVSPTVNSVELCVINSLRKRILTLAYVAVDGSAGDRVVFDIGDVDASPFSVINREIFSTTCVQCHGATGHAAAGLDLQPDKAYEMLVNVPSTVVDGMRRVAAGDASASTLWQAVATDVSSTWKFHHNNLLTPDQSAFIENWINNLQND